MKEDVISTNEKNFIIEALQSSQRLDGRRPYDMRSVYFSFGEQLGQVEVQLGESRVLVVITGDVVAPRSHRPTEGFFQFQTEFSPMACIEFDNDRKTATQIELGRIVERGLRDSRAIDTEALCILAGEKVWAIKCFIHILDHGGNLIDCCCLATITALLHFRRPDVTVVGDEVTIHTLKDRLPVPLSVHHIPISITFGIFEEGSLIVCDPAYKEEQTMESRMTFTLNAQGEICAVQKAGGTPLYAEKIMECTRVAAEKVKHLDALIKKNLEFDVERRKSKQPISKATTPATFIKQSKWEEIYNKDQESKSEIEKMDIEGVTPNTKTEETKILEETPPKEEKMDKSSTVANSDTLFSGGSSAWDEDIVEETENPKKEIVTEDNNDDYIDLPMEDASDSEEEETIVLQSTNATPQPSEQVTDLSAALKPKTRRNKK